MKDILFLPLDIPYLTIDYDKLVSVAQTLDTIADEYRNCEHLGITFIIESSRYIMKYH